jgi:hypothetical protein
VKKLKDVQDEVIRQNNDEHLKIQSAEDMLVQHDVENQIDHAPSKFQQYSIFLKTSDPTHTAPKYPPRAEGKNFNSNIIFDYSDRVSQALSKQTIADSLYTEKSMRSSAFTRTVGQNSSKSSHQPQLKSAKKNSNGSNTSSLHRSQNTSSGQRSQNTSSGQRSQNAPSENNTGSEKGGSQDFNGPP